MVVNQLGNHRIMRLMAGAAAAAVLAFSPVGGGAMAQPASVVQRSMPDFTQVVEQTEASVVNIRTTETVRVRRAGPGGTDPYEMFRWFFGPDFMPPMPGQPRDGGQPSEQERTVPRGVGSGFIISEDGFILTNNHVVAGSSDIFVTLTDGKEHKARIVGTDSRTDLALLKIDARGLKPLPIGESRSLRKGQWVLAIGSPFGLESTVTAGIVSAINRDTGDYLPFIQTDVAVNPGNSGGPLFDAGGRVIGINSSIATLSGGAAGSIGLGFAIPVNLAKHVAEQLVDSGRAQHAFLGVTLADGTAEVDGVVRQGAVVGDVVPGSPAEGAQLEPGDVIVAIDGKPVASSESLTGYVRARTVGQESTLTVVRDGASREVPVTLTARDDGTLRG
jgi:serine protease Do